WSSLPRRPPGSPTARCCPTRTGGGGTPPCAS
ncbi:MAG: hypothetical protein AVDCRST_MAG57-2213, partial [uncultured Blastococcus sp.]